MSKIDKLYLYLQKNPGWHTSQELAVEVGLSKRTVKSYVNRLRNQGLKIVSSNKGYKLSHDTSPSRLTKDSDSGLPDTGKERQNFLINYLINTNSSVNLYDLSNMLYIGDATTLQDLKSVQRFVGRFGLTLERHGDEWTLTGNERQKRSLLSSLIYKETSGTFMNQDIIQNNFPNINVEKLRKIIQTVLNENNLYLNTFDLNNVLLHFVISIVRSNKGHKIKESDLTKNGSETNSEVDLVHEIAKRAGVKFTSTDNQELALIIRASAYGEGSAVKYISDETRDLVKDLIDYVWQTYNIDLNNDIFKARFSLHLDRLLQRAKMQNTEHNPIAMNIKISSPTIYECAVLMAHRIELKTKVQLDDSEIAYIALHVGTSIAEQLSNKAKLNVVVLIPKYYNNVAYITSCLERNFDKYINIYSVIHDQRQLNDVTAKIDLLIVVNSNYVDDQIYTVNISQFFLDKDEQKVDIAIKTKRRLSKQEHFQEHLLTFFEANNFEYTDKVKNIDQAFDLIFDHFHKEKIVNSNFKSLLYKREEMSSTAFGRVAIPHSLDMNAKKSRGFIIVNPHGIKWSDNNEVYLVIGLAIDPNNKKLFRDVFDELSDVATDVNNVTQLISCRDYSSFILKLVSLL